MTSAVLNSTGTTITIQWAFGSRPKTTFTFEFFASPAGDSDPEGKQFLGAVAVTTDGQGRFTAQFTVAVPLGDLITATATEGFTGVGNTSEFSNAVVVS